MAIRRPGVTLTAALCLALGIGATTVVFGLVKGTLLDPYAFSEPEEIVTIWTQFRLRGIDESYTSGKELNDYREQQSIFEGVEALNPWYFNLTGGDGEPARLVGGMVSAGLFPMLGVTPQEGRNFLAEEGVQKAKVVIISHRLWQRRFGSDRDLVGGSISLDGESHTVVGVLPPDCLLFFETADVWVPWTPNLQWPRQARTGLAIARLEPGITLERAQADMDIVAGRMQEANPEAYPEGSGWGLRVKSLSETLTGDVRPQLMMMFAAVALVLLIACVNVANLLLAQAPGREREVALRAALGAGRLVLVRQMLIESLPLVLLGGGLGLLLALWGVRAVAALDLPEIPRLAEISVDWGVLAFAAAVALLTGILFGLVPALKTSSIQLYDSLREGTRASETGAKQLSRNLLVVTQIALALVVLVGAGLVTKVSKLLDQTEPGFRTHNVVTTRLFLPRAKYRTADDLRGFYRHLMTGLEARPEFETVGLVSHLPLAPLDLGGTIAAEGREPAPGQPDPAVGWRIVSPDYFQAIGIPLLSGRPLDDRDDAESEPVVIVDAGLAERLWPGEDALGKRLKLERDPMDWRRVVGVVGSIKDRDLLGEDDELVYVPFLQYPYAVAALTLDTPATLASAGAAVREVIAGIDPNQPITDLERMEALLDFSKSSPRFNRMLFGLFGLTALILVSVGVYGVMACSVSQRTREIGLRRALGAQRGEVLGMILRQGMRLAAVGWALGLALVFALSIRLDEYLSKLLRALVRATDATTLIVVSLVLAALALAASLLPALRASRVDPIIALRDE